MAKHTFCKFFVYLRIIINYIYLNYIYLQINFPAERAYDFEDVEILSPIIESA
jgi:hypothetical protein